MMSNLFPSSKEQFIVKYISKLNLKIKYDVESVSGN